MRAPLLLVLAPLAAGCIDTQLSAAASKVAVNPALVDLGVVAPGDTATATVSVSSVSLGALTVSSLAISGNDAEVFALGEDVSGTKLAKGEAIDVPLAFTPNAVGAYEADLTIQTDANTGDAAVVVHLRGLGASPSLVVSPPSIDFGRVDPGADVFAPVTLQCIGPVDATLLTAEVSGDASFYLDPVTVPSIVGTGGALVLNVGFGPTDAAAQAAHLTLTTDDPTQPNVSIPIIANTCLGEGADDADGDGWSACAGDCDDADASVFPNAPEALDGLDGDCDGLIDEGTTAYDDDGDGFAEAEGDCNDGDATVSPDGAETENGIDDNCNGRVDDGTDAYDDDGDGVTEDGGDCDDSAAGTGPGAPEVADGLDNDCDGVIDEDTDAGDDDGDGYAEGTGDCDDSAATVHPGAGETANGIDDDCDGTVDEGTTAYDDDGDGYTEAGGDCDDSTTSIGPHRLEVSGDGLDNDCDGVTE